MDLGWPQKQVAEQLRVHVTTVRNWEGNHSSPDLRFLPRIFDFLGYAPYSPPEGFPDWLRTARKARGLSQKQLGELLSVDESTVWKWEKGKSRPRKISLQRLKSLSASGLSRLLSHSNWARSLIHKEIH